MHGCCTQDTVWVIRAQQHVRLVLKLCQFLKRNAKVGYKISDGGEFVYFSGFYIHRKRLRKHFALQKYQSGSGTEEQFHEDFQMICSKEKFLLHVDFLIPRSQCGSEIIFVFLVSGGRTPRRKIKLQRGTCYLVGRNLGMLSQVGERTSWKTIGASGRV